MTSFTRHEPGRTAVILQFPRKRGRPKSAHRGNDTGTPELARKKRAGETTEALDLCMERNLITPGQHWCGIHLRWLYTLRHGVPSVRAVDPTHIPGSELKADDPQWRAAREKEYHDAIRKLMGRADVPLIMSICVYNERPAFLQSRRKCADYSDSVRKLRDALDILVTHWGKK